MLLAVEGGGFFSSSASGYSKGLNLLILGAKNEGKPMRVTPWNNQYQLDKESDSDLQLASKKNCLVRGCASLVCFGGAAEGLETQYPVGSTQKKQDVVKSSFDFEKVEENDLPSDLVDGDNINSKSVNPLKSSLKRPVATVPVSIAVTNEGEGNGHRERREVQWTDVSGGELFEIREFEPSEHSDSDDEFENGNKHTCACTIM